MKKQTLKNKTYLLGLLIAGLLLMSACSLPAFEIGDLLATLMPGESTAVVCPTCEPAVICETSVVGSTEVPPTATESVELTATPTEEIPTPKPVISETPVPTLTNTPMPTATPEPVVYPYKVQPGSPVYVDNIFHSELGSQWMGISGQIFNAMGEPQPFIVVRVNGVLEGNVVDLISMTGVARFLGPEGYEIQLSNRGVDSLGTLEITLFDLAGNQISESYPFDTYSAANQAQCIFNFIVNQ